MLNNGQVFARSMRESYEEKAGFIGFVTNFDVELISKKIDGDISELVFHYKMTNANGTVNEFTGKHIQTWKNSQRRVSVYLIYNQ
jgi:hypothetical protein